MRFDSSYFKDEVREGFYIPGMVKRSWAMQLEVLETIEAICKKYSIEWFADCGTLIGTIRHGGFIPWDDDLDICMLRNDYKRFIEAAGRELPNGYRLLNLDTEPEYDNFITRIVASQTINIGNDYLLNHHGFPYTAGVDIFPLDYLYDDEEVENERRARAKRLYDEASASADISIRRKMMRMIEAVFEECKGEGSDKVALMSFYIKDKSHIYPISYFEQSVNMPFENTFIRVPAAYDEVLKIEYGNWYVASKKGGIHDYPFYAEQQKTLIEKTGSAPYIYIPNDIEESLWELRERRKKHKLQTNQPCIDGVVNISKEVIFAPVLIDDWKYMKPYYDKVCSMDCYDVYVMPVQYAYRRDDGTTERVGYDYELFANMEEKLPLIRYDEYPFERKHPHMIVIQNPFDKYQSAFTVHPFFYATNIYAYTDNLVYCQGFMVDEIKEGEEKSYANISRCILSPGVLFADTVYVPTESMKSVYKNILTEQDFINDTELDDKICVINYDINYGYSKNEKKQLLFYVGICDYYSECHDAIKWIRHCMDVFSEYSDKIDIVWVEEDCMEYNVIKVCPDIYEEYMELKQNCIYMSNVRMVDISEIIDNINDYSGFYGTGGYLMNLCVREHIPVMVRDIKLAI